MTASNKHDMKATDGEMEVTCDRIERNDEIEEGRYWDTRSQYKYRCHVLLMISGNDWYFANVG